MSAFWILSFVAVAGAVVCVLDPFQWFAGSGARRSTAKPTAEARRKPARACENCGHLPGMPTRAELAESDRTDPAPHISAPAPVDNGSRDTPLANAETQPVDVRDLRDAIGEGDTVTLPAVAPITPVVPLHDAPLPPVTWGTNPKALEDWATGTAPGPMHEVPVGLGSKASVKVHAVLEEAS